MTSSHGALSLASTPADDPENEWLKFGPALIEAVKNRSSFKPAEGQKGTGKVLSSFHMSWDFTKIMSHTSSGCRQYGIFFLRNVPPLVLNPCCLNMLQSERFDMYI